jgi:nucleotide-binding universal stress UspA family protein
MFRNVLVGYEGSERSEDALALGHALAAADGAVTAVCAYWYEPLSSRVGPGGPGEMTMRAGAEETLAPLRDRSDAATETLAIPAASPARALRELAEEEDHDLIVVGSTDRGAVGCVFAGTTADGLLHGGPCPIAVAPRGYHRRPRRLRRIGVAYDGSEASQVGLDTARRLATERGAELTILRALNHVPVPAAGDVGSATVIDDPDLRAAAQADLDDVVDRLRASGVAVTGELLEGAPGLVLAQRCKDLDLLVAGSRGHGRIGRVFLGSVSHYLMSHNTAPVVVIPPKD